MLVFAAVLILSGCVAMPDKKETRIKSVQNLAPVYNFHDDAKTRRRVALTQNLGRAYNQFNAGDDAAAERLIQDVLRQDPSSIDAWTLRAAIYSRRGDVVRSGEYYRKAAELAPQRGDVLNNYGAWLCANGYPTEALVWFERAMTDPAYGEQPGTLANAGGCALQSGQRDRAEHDLRRALELDPGNAYALESMARSEYDKHRYFEARAFSERRLATAPATASVLKLAIQIEQGLGDKAAASRYQQRLIKEFPENVAAEPRG
ncbi:type IV pilus biogenesis/stability protein PilW [Xylella taiwanensis]|nr:fimbrial protein [Xylella taiwanensis]